MTDMPECENIVGYGSESYDNMFEMLTLGTKNDPEYLALLRPRRGKIHDHKAVEISGSFENQIDK